MIVLPFRRQHDESLVPLVVLGAKYCDCNTFHSEKAPEEEIFP